MGHRQIPLPSNDQIKSYVQQMVRAEFFSGPLPPPEKFEKYNQILPGAAERILKMAEEQGAHRRELERKTVEGDIRRASWGSVAAFLFGMSIIAVGSVLLFLGKDIQGLTALVIAIAPIMSAFLIGSSKRKKERLEKYGKDVS